MSKCPDCDSVKILWDEGDGKCSTCHGTGAGGILDHIAHEMIPIGEASCGLYRQASTETGDEK